MGQGLASVSIHRSKTRHTPIRSNRGQALFLYADIQIIFGTVYNKRKYKQNTGGLTGILVAKKLIAIELLIDLRNLMTL